MLDIVCLRHGEIYDWTWVDKVYNGAKRSISQEFNFHVFTDKIEESRTQYNQILLPDLGNSGYEKNAGAWWYKVWMFSGEHPLQRPILYFDLDNIFLGNCDFLLECPDNMFGCFREWKINAVKRETKELMTKSFMINSSIMKFDPREYRYIWDNYIANKQEIQEKFHGDQDYITSVIDRSKLFQYDNKTKIISYEYHMLRGGIKKLEVIKRISHSKAIVEKEFNEPSKKYVLPEGARIVICNGYRNKPNLLADLGFIKEFWV